MNVGKVFIIIV